jgi:hypothetical protein
MVTSIILCFANHAFGLVPFWNGMTATIFSIALSVTKLKAIAFSNSSRCISLELN